MTLRNELSSLKSADEDIRKHLKEIRDVHSKVCSQIHDLKVRIIKDEGLLKKFTWRAWIGDYGQMELTAEECHTANMPELCELFHMDPSTAHWGHTHIPLRPDPEEENKVPYLNLNDGEVSLSFTTWEDCVEVVKEFDLTLNYDRLVGEWKRTMEAAARVATAVVQLGGKL